MKKMGFGVVVAIGAVFLSGCGTICNLASCGNMENYGGVKKDVGFLENTQLHPSSSILTIVVCPAIGAELSLSLLGDTLALPLTSYVQSNRNERESKERIDGGGCMVTND
jgi:hypothetical protein